MAELTRSSTSSMALAWCESAWRWDRSVPFTLGRPTEDWSSQRSRSLLEWQQRLAEMTEEWETASAVQLDLMGRSRCHQEILPTWFSPPVVRVPLSRAQVLNWASSRSRAFAPQPVT